MNEYDDTIDRLAKAIASQINTVNDYENSINKLESVMTTNDYAVTMIDLISKYTDQEIVKAYYLLKQTKKKKKTSCSLDEAAKYGLLNIFRRKK